MKSRFIKPALFVLLGIFIGMYSLRCGNDAGIGSDFDASKYYTTDQIESLIQSVDDAALDGGTGNIPDVYKGVSIDKLYLKDLQNLQEYIKVITDKTTITLTDVTNTVQRLKLTCETYGGNNPPIAAFEKYRFARLTGDPAEDGIGIYWPITVGDINDVVDGDDNYKLIYVTAIMK
jgi:hypothetical protein